MEKNNSTLENVEGIGPLPRGRYAISAPYNHPILGPYVMNLKPTDQDMYGRDKFRIHADSIKNPGRASEGCIVMSRSTRQRIWNSRDHTIVVIN